MQNIDRTMEYARARHSGIVGPWVFVCEHASPEIPEEFSNLGLDAKSLSSHIAFDPGAFELMQQMAALLGGATVHQSVSRLLYDCNRPPEADSAIPSKSEMYEIPGNRSLNSDERKRRISLFYGPFRRLLEDVLNGYSDGVGSPILVTVHSFTPVYFGKIRDIDIGILHDSDKRLADALLSSLEDCRKFDIRRNEPYGPDDGVTHTLREHALTRNLLNVMIEVKNTLLQTEENRQQIAVLLSRHLKLAIDNLVAMDEYDSPIVGFESREEMNA